MMRKTILPALLLLSASGAFAQTDAKLTTGTLLTLNRYHQEKSAAVRSATHGDEDRMTAFIRYEGTATIDSLRMLGAHVRTTTAHVLTATLPFSAVERICQLQGVKVIEAAQPAQMLTDISRQTTRTDLVQAGTPPLDMPFLGRGVVVGDIDGGLDFAHPAFYTSDRSQLRLKRAWMQAETEGGRVPEGFGYGREFVTEEELVAKGCDMGSYAHSTHVLGIAAGADTLGGNKYYGIAREADIVFSDFSSTDTGIMDAMSYIFSYADSTGQPAVVNMSLGTQMGPHDGTSLRDQMADELTGPGRIIVGAVGNDGLVDTHVSKAFTGEADSLIIGIAFLETLGMPGSGELQLWGSEGGSFKVNVCTFDKKTMEPVYKSRAFTASRSTNQTVVLQKPYDKSGGSFTIITQQSPLNNRPTAHITLNITDYKPDKVIGLIVTADAGEVVHGWCNPTYCCFRKHLDNMDMPDNSCQPAEIGGTGRSIISVGAYTTRPIAISADGDTINAAPPSLWPEGFPAGDHAPFSNSGPTVDGRMKPDVTAPGCYIISAMNRYSLNDPAYVWKSSDEWNGRQYGYGAMMGTSMAAPHVAGIVAVWLEADPTLTPDDIRRVLEETAIRDEYTGHTPNNTWGYGKIDAYSGLLYILNEEPSAIAHVQSLPDYWRASPQADGLHILCLKNMKDCQLLVTGADGTVISTASTGSKTIGDEIIVGLAGHPSGIYLVTIASGNEKQTFKFINY